MSSTTKNGSLNVRNHGIQVRRQLRRSNHATSGRTMDRLIKISEEFVDELNVSSHTLALSEDNQTIHSNQERSSLYMFMKAYLQAMSVNTTRRGKRKNAVKLYSSNNNKIKDAIKVVYSEAVVFDKDHTSSDEIDMHLTSATHLVQEFAKVGTLISSMVNYLPDNLKEEGYAKPQAFIFSMIEEEILSNLSLQNKDCTKVTPKDAAKILTWIEDFLVNIESTYLDFTISSKWQVCSDDLLNHYINLAVHGEMRKLFQRSIEMCTNDDVRMNRNGMPVTGQSEEIAFIVNAQLDIAQNHLPERYLGQVLVACNKEISIMVAEFMLQVGAMWRETSVSRFCSIVNDISRLAELIEERNEEELMIADDLFIGESAVRDLAELSLHTIDFLCERIMLDLCEPEPILSSIGSTQWEEDEEGIAIARTIATFRDFFSDLEVWLSAEYYFPKVLNRCFELTVQMYVQSFFSNTLSRSIKDPAIVAENLYQDYLRLTIFFNGTVFERYAGKAGLYTSQIVNSRLVILQSMSRIVNPTTSVTDLDEDIITILSKTARNNEHNSAAVMHLAGLRKVYTNSESIEWLRMIAHAEKALQEREQLQSIGKKNDTSFVSLPDLRNSINIRNIRVRTTDMYRRISVQSLQSVETMKNIIEVNSPKNKLYNFATKNMNKVISATTTSTTTSKVILVGPVHQPINHNTDTDNNTKPQRQVQLPTFLNRFRR